MVYRAGGTRTESSMGPLPREYPLEGPLLPLLPPPPLVGDRASPRATPALDRALAAPDKRGPALASGPLLRALLAPDSAVPAPLSAVLDTDRAPSHAADVRLPAEREASRLLAAPAYLGFPKPSMRLPDVPLLGV